MKREVAGISLFFCLIAPLVATFSYLHSQKSAIRKEVKHQLIAGLDREELVLLKFTEEESRTKLRWEHSKEFEFNGQMYDVVEKERKGDTIYYWCWWDYEETVLNKKLSGFVAELFGNSPQKKEKEDQIVEFYKNLYCSNGSISLTILKPHSTHSGQYQVSYSTMCVSPHVPPPRLS